MMENFGIFCTFVIAISILVGITHLLRTIWVDKSGNDGNAETALIMVLVLDLLYLFIMYHHGLWMIIRDR